MQQSQQKEEERYTDGFAEYGNFYGGPSFNYLAPAKSASCSIQEMPGEPIHTPIMSTHASSDSYPIATNMPQFNKETDGLQLASPYNSYVSHQVYAQGLMVDSRYRNPKMGYTMSPPGPAPLNYVHKAPRTDSRLSQFPQAFFSPIVQQQPTQPSRCPSGPGSPRSPGLQQHPVQPSQPAPLRFKRSSTLPPTPPMSFGSSASNEDGLPERLQSLYVSGQYSEVSKYPFRPLIFAPGTLGSRNTMSSISSGRSSTHASSPVQSIPTSPFGGEDKFSVALSNLSSQENGTPEMDPNDARAEVLRRLSSKEEMSSRKGSMGSGKKGFSLTRTNTSTKGPTGHSQDALTDVLEDVALEGNLSLVKAIIALGADPIYRSTWKLKKVRHEALQKATINGHAKVVDHLLQRGASYGETQKKGTYTPLDRALLAAVYKGYAELATSLITSHGANPMIEQWPREMYDTQHYWAENQVRLSRTSVLDGICKWKNVDQGRRLLKVIMRHPNFNPTAHVAGVFDTKSELQTPEFSYRPWQTTYEYSALACFISAGWADVVEEMLNIKGIPKDYEKEDVVLQYQDKVTRHVYPANALTKETWDKRPEDALRILKLLIDRNFDVSLAQRTATDMGQRTALGRALSADAAQGVELLLQHQPSLVREEISFRRNKKETRSLPLAAALFLGSLETARVLLRAGAHPRDPAFEEMNALQFAAHQGGETGAAILTEMIGLAPELTYDALDIAIKRMNRDSVRVVLDSISAAALREQIAALPPVYDMLLYCSNTDENDATKDNYLSLIEMVVAWDAGHALQRPQLPAILSAIRRDNYVGMEKLLKSGVVDGKSLVLNCKAQPLGEQGLWTMLECCELTDRSNEWLGLLRYYGAPLYQ
ncbi:Nn.00g022080.m01.CDS01 [Neocucurbitaria sp. VM-36]